jgi:serine O-acetyltransferase
MDAINFHNVALVNGVARVGAKVYIGTGAVISGVVSVVDDVVIGANAVVNFDVESETLALGAMATVKGGRRVKCYEYIVD